MASSLAIEAPPDFLRAAAIRGSEAWMGAALQWFFSVDSRQTKPQHPGMARCPPGPGGKTRSPAGPCSVETRRKDRARWGKGGLLLRIPAGKFTFQSKQLGRFRPEDF